jgi:hypothetical protein
MDIEEFVRIEKRIDAAVERQAEAEVLHADAVREELRARWESGREMLAERKGKQLPKGRLDKLVEATGKSQRELGYRMQFAERYPTEDEVCSALQTFTSWRQVCKSLPKLSDAKPPAPRPRKKSEEIQPEVAAKLDAAAREGTRLNVTETAAELGTSTMPVREALLREEGRAEGRAEAGPLAWDTIPGNQRDKLDRAKASIRRELEREFRARLLAEVDQYKAQCDANVAAYKAKLNVDAQRERAQRDEERKRYQLTIEVYRAKGLITPDEYNIIRSCLHPDSRGSVTDEKLAAAFRVFNDSRIRTLLVKEK